MRSTFLFDKSLVQDQIIYSYEEPVGVVTAVERLTAQSWRVQAKLNRDVPVKTFFQPKPKEKNMKTSTA